MTLAEKSSNVTFAGYRVAISGGTRGIGRDIAVSFALAGATVSICGRSREAMEEVAKLSEVEGSIAHTHCCDLRDDGAAVAYITSAASALGGLDILINNATASRGDAFPGSWHDNFLVDLKAIVKATETAVPFISKRPGNIVNIASIAALRATPRTPSYGAIKAALLQYTKTCAVELAKHNIRVNAVLPGAVEYPGGNWARRRTEQPDLYADTLAQIKLGRMGRPSEITDSVQFLASPRAAWITGAFLVVDGGQSL